MLDNIIKFSIKNKLIIGAFVLVLIGWGIYSLKQLPIDAVPDITNNQVQIITSAPSQSAEDIERLVTFPIEMTMSSIPNIEEVRSFSRFGLSVVTIVFKDDVDIYWARQQISERLNEAKSNIPDGVGSPEMAPVTTGLGEIYQYTLFAEEGFKEKFPIMELRSLQDWIVRRQLLGIEGIADVSSFGGFLKQYEVALQPERLQTLGVSINEVLEALSKNNQNTGGAYIDKNPKAYFIRSQGLIQNSQDIQNIVIKNTQNGTPVLIKDIGKVQLGSAIRYGAMTRNGEGEVVGGIVMMLKGANSSKVIKRVKDRVAQIQKSLPEGVVIQPFLDRTKLVDKAISTVATNLIEGALIVILILVLLLGNLRAGLIVASVIPLAMLFAIILMNLFGVSGNLMSLGAIDFGIIVDGSVIIVEATLHYLVMKKSGKKLTQSEMDEEVYQSASKIRTSAAFGEIIILIVYLPILALVGIEGKMFKPMAITVSFAILGAFILSLTYVPMISALFLKKTITDKKNISDKIIGALQNIYSPILEFVLSYKKSVLIGAVLIFLLSLFTFKNMGSEFIPSLDEGDLAVQATVSTGSSLSYTIDVTNKSSKLLLAEFPDEIEQIVSRIGSSEIPTDPMPVEVADIIIILKDKNDWTKARTKNELTQKMNHLLDENMLGVNYGFQQPIQMRFNELMTGARQDVVLKIYGEDLDKLVKYANELGKIIPEVAGAEDLYIEKMTGLKQIVIDYKRSQLALYGLNISDVNTAVNTAFAGQSAGSVYEGEQRYDLVVRMNKQNRAGINDIRKLYVTTSNGAQIPLENVAHVSFKTGPNQIQRDDAKRRITVGFNVRGRDVASIVAELQQKVSEKIPFDTGYYITYGGTFKNLEEARARLGIAVPVALLLIFLLLYFTFKSIKQSFLIYTAIPMSAIGGIFALWCRDMPFSISAGIGFIALFGVAVLNGIVLIAEFNRLKEAGMTDIKAIIKKGTSVRLRPVIMTAMVASLGFLPMAISASAGAEVQKPLATVVIGGLISATLLTLLILPVLYLFSESKNAKSIKINSKILSLLFIISGSLCVQAQEITNKNPQKLSEQNVIAIALKKSVARYKSALNIVKNKAGIASAITLNPIAVKYQDVGVSAGLSEKEWSANQNFGAVLTHLQKRKLAISKHELAIAENDISVKETIRTARSLYQQWHYLYGLISLLEEQTKNSNLIKSISNKLYDAGEIGGLENDLTILQSLGTQAKKSSIYKDFTSVENKLKEVLQIKTAIIPETKFPIKKMLKNAVLLQNNGKKDSLSKAFLEILSKREKVAKKNILVAKSSYFPEITAGIINRKTGNATDYTGFNIGLNVPISFWANNAKIKQQKIISEEIAFENQANKIAIQNNFKSLQEQLTYLKTELVGIEAMKIKADKFIKKLKIAYSVGEIDAYKYNQSFNTYFQVMQNYLLLIHNYNQTVISYEFYTKNN
ncbi:CusA/CzcA family heavy metal efflux RND transporter [Tenacibaculum finnmarkense]|uniref:CusA/CzcA family heavy metal efflux RND transporter n=1 Tax=Tenacibaculum finnmarkense genomovar finnmarkense TaxID=1458503 RepID=A0AAP1WH14_9FLAO|nr:CusA/CzcA family heavy metal efflux RND transporter [Tenacibaculum finnmarkense]MBE7653659.1 CusA/CzcA family heavy metal efflux RND transporter [Tenacibaculum finnmarkense genomovar finnmarkense]MBE7695949.1 CusA/CzcA family heavy metal efflux RND transporter [Tenacibaculum finnmarkense genomovar finnmarkense]MCD8428162.1 CusA/CzcA family heavy metal efflux RND transporter [Tenacibaculum finnmarkense genomovar finnmarkense]MCG8731932.1 CusA/CzcA family heavy metal efflux RND transporter [Te